ncbi:tetratricopeptide repeat protein [Thiocapsa bogorovii]|uniref:tetratricopeptide repeat protein n=1 Tax=Thiocapsa bogorovii TaxID=521689 RepID=UPI001E35603C|nr:tetratricopeptide repeat protein [Thiocapsa bogorovii]UHD15502.1 tetratricopeptide repeat protein [Thiocapsa bogorovii]
MRIYWWRGLLVLGALGLAWASLVNGLAGYYADRVAAGDTAMIDHALGWRSDQSATLFLKALQVLPDDPAAGARLLEAAYRANPADPRPLIALAARSLEDGDVERSEALIELAGRLAPVDPRVQLAVAAYWGQRGRYDRMLVHWSTTLEADSSQRKLLFPDLLKIAESLEYRALLGSMALSPPPWWTDYFRYVARTAVDTDTVRFLYTSRRQSASAPPTPDERAAYVERLQKDGAIAEAYVVWVSGLDDTKRRQLGLLYDGGFELPIEGRGFDWRLVSNAHFSAGPVATRGSNGRAALRLSFRAFEGPFRHLSQPLFLDAGRYRLSGRVRVDSLTSQGGVKWTIRCVLPDSAILGEGARFLGSSDWRDFDLYFEVPETCFYQQLTLVSGGSRAFEQKLDGTLWFDDLKIVRAAALDAAARVDALMRDLAEPASSSGNVGADVKENSE